MDESIDRLIEGIRKPEFWKQIWALGPLVTLEEEWGLPEPGSIEHFLMRASQVKFPDPVITKTPPPNPVLLRAYRMSA